MRPTMEEMVKVVDGWLDAEAVDVRNEFINSSEDELISYHHILGRRIRNSFQLWEYKHTPDIRDGIDFSPEHPDAISFEVIKQVWQKRQST